jgi:hypothetical protein
MTRREEMNPKVMVKTRRVKVNKNEVLVLRYLIEYVHPPQNCSKAIKQACIHLETHLFSSNFKLVHYIK